MPTTAELLENIARAKENLKSLKPGDQVYFTWNGSSDTGMRRYYDVYQVAFNPHTADKQGRWEIYRITWSVSVLTGYNYSDKKEALYINGVGFSAEDEITRALGRALLQDEKAFEYRRL